MLVDISKRDVIWSYLGTVLNMGANFLILPFIIYFLSNNELGLWYIFASIATFASLFDCGFAVTFARNITYCWSGAKYIKKSGTGYAKSPNVDFVLMKKILISCQKIYLMLAFTVLLVLSILGTIYINYITKGLSEEKYIYAWAIHICAIFLNLYYGYYAAFLRGVGAVAEANINIVLSRLLQIVFTVILLCSGMGLVGACIAYLIYGISFRLLGKIKFLEHCDIGKHLETVGDTYSYQDVKDIVKIVWYNAWRDGLVAISNYFSIQSSTIICSLYFTLQETGVYSIGVQLAMAVAQISGTLYSAYQPALQSAYVRRDIQSMKKYMSLIISSFVILFLVVYAGLLNIGLPLLRIIKPEAIVEYNILFGLCLYQFIIMIRNFYTSYFSCTNRLIYVKAFVISSILCIILSFYFVGCLELGIWGLITAQLFSQLIFNAWYWPMMGNRELGLNVYEIFMEGIAIIKNIRGYVVRRG